MAEILPLGRMSKRIGFPRDELKGMAEAGRIPCLQVGKQYFFCPSAVLEALAALASRPARGDKAGTDAPQGDAAGRESTIWPAVRLGAVDDPVLAAPDTF